MARELAKSTIERLSGKLDEEQVRLENIIAQFEEEREEVRLSETSAEHSADPDSSEGGSLAFEMEKELSLEGNTRDLLAKVRRAQDRVTAGTYGTCEACGQPIPLARLEALPYVTTCVSCASSR